MINVSVMEELKRENAGDVIQHASLIRKEFGNPNTGIPSNNDLLWVLYKELKELRRIADSKVGFKTFCFVLGGLFLLIMFVLGLIYNIKANGGL